MTREVLGSANGPNGCVGWIEERGSDIDVRATVDGRLHVSRLESYNTFFGCSVHAAAWVAGGFVFVYTEKHRTILARFAAPYREQQLVSLHDEFLIVGERVVDLDRWTGLLHVRRLADLEPGIAVLTELAYVGSLPCAQELRRDTDGGVVQVISGAASHSIPLPPDRRLPPPQQLRARWVALLGGGSEAEGVVDALADAWLAPQQTTGIYGFDPRSRKKPGEGWPQELRDNLPKTAPINGWPSEGTFDERLDRMFLAHVGRVAAGE